MAGGSLLLIPTASSRGTEGRNGGTTLAAKYAAFFDRVMIPPYGWARSKKALVARNVATATDYYKAAYN